MYNKQFAANVRSECKKKKIAVHKLFDMCGVRKGLLYDIEKRGTDISAGTALTIADALGVSLDALYGRQLNDPNTDNPLMKPLQTSSKFYYDLARIADKQGMTLTQLCEQLTGGQSELELWKRGYISAEHLIKISRLWNCSTDYILRIMEINLSKSDEMTQNLVSKYKTLTFDQKISVLNYIISLENENTR